MEMQKDDFRIFYNIIKNFIDAVDTENLDILKNKFSIIDDNIVYIYDTLGQYSKEKVKVSILSFDEAYRYMIEEERGFEIFKFNDVECWGIDCNLVVNGKIDEPIFHFRICKNDKEYNLEFLYIGS